MLFNQKTMSYVMQSFLLVAIMCIGQVVGSLLSALATPYLGRKIVVLASCPPGFMGWILQVINI